MKFKHLILTRFNYPENHPNRKDRIELFHRFCEPSIRNQINKNFEWIIISKKTITINDLFVTMDHQKLKNHLEYLKKDFDWIITTRFDCDDFLFPTFTEALHNTIQEKEEIIDFSGYRYDLRNKLFYSDTKYQSHFLSPFISLVEKLKTYKGVYFDQHTKMKDYFPIKKVSSKQWVQIIHNTNKILNKHSKEEIDQQGKQIEVPSIFTPYTKEYF